MKWAMTQKFREYLLGQKCVVWTDNNPLSYLNTAKLGATEHRWVAELAVFDYTVRYRPGRSNQNADALSRQHPSQAEVEPICPGPAVPYIVQKADKVSRKVQFAILAVPERSTDDILALQSADSAISAVLSFVLQERFPVGLTSRVSLLLP